MNFGVEFQKNFYNILEEIHMKIGVMSDTHGSLTYFEKALDIRRSGSAALDLCSIAAGRAELYFELQLSPWDYAAGSLIVEEAGGVVTDIDGEPIQFERPSSILAQNKQR